MEHTFENDVKLLIEVAMDLAFDDDEAMEAVERLRDAIEKGLNHYE